MARTSAAGKSEKYMCITCGRVVYVDIVDEEYPIGSCSQLVSRTVWTKDDVCFSC